MARRLAIPLALALLTFSSVAAAQAPAGGPPGPWRNAEAPARPSQAFDPLLPTSITAIAGGGSLLLLGLVQKPEEPPVEECGLSGCAVVDGSESDTSWSTPLLAGGATAAAGGLTLLLVSLNDPAEHADAGRARVAAGGMTLSLGAGLAVTGLTALGTGQEGVVAPSLLATGIVTSAVAAPILAWGVATWDDDASDATYSSTGRIVAGSILTGAGVMGTAGGVALVAANVDCGGGLCGFYSLFALPFFGVGGVGLGLGIPLLAGGADVEESNWAPAIAAGPTSIEATWRLP